jgi:16S rRNA (adenine1518-N6/adenine1519-N6)-dimethyltransferase
VSGFDAGPRPRKRFGQNFLTDAGVVDRILAVIRAQPADTVVEIGPGRGALTEGLIASGARLHLVEIDRDLAAAWRAREGERLTLHEADALDFDFAALATDGAPLRVVGNLPYNISTPLLFHLLEQSRAIRDMHFMLQREVVERLGAEPGTADYGRLSVMVQYQCRVEPLIAVPPGAFFPPPRVHSAVVRLLPGHFDHGVCTDPALLARIVRQAFSQRRKTLRNALAGLVDVSLLAPLGIDAQRRPETLSVAEFVRVADAASAALRAAEA